MNKWLEVSFKSFWAKSKKKKNIKIGKIGRKLYFLEHHPIILCPFLSKSVKTLASQSKTSLEGERGSKIQVGQCDKKCDMYVYGGTPFQQNMNMTRL